MDLRRRALTLVSRVVLARPAAVVALAAALGVAAFLGSRHIPLHSSRLDFLSPDDPVVESYRRYADEFGSLGTVLLVVHGPPAERRAFADEAAPALRALPELRTVIHRVDLDRYRATGLYLQSRERLEEIRSDLVNGVPVLRETALAPSLAAWLRASGEEMGDEEAPVRPAGEVARAVDTLDVGVRALGDGLAGGAEPVRLLPGFSSTSELYKRIHVDDAGYFASEDGQLGLIVLAPAVRMERDPVIERFRDALAARLDPLLARHPHVSIEKTGGPLRDLEEHDAVDRDLVVTSAASGVAVFLLLWMGCRSLVPAILLLFVLVLSILYTLFAARSLVGHLNLLSSVYVAILFGLGDDFGSYLILRAWEWYPARGARAVADATVDVGASVLTGAMTIAAAFYALLVHELPAFRELGAIVGTGVLITYAAMVTVLPACLSLQLALTGERFLPRPGARPPWLARAIPLLSRRPAAVVGLALALTLACLPSWNGNRFDYDLSRMLPADGEAARTQELVKRAFGLSPDFDVVLSRDLDGARAACDALKDARSVARIDSLALTVPAGLAGKRPLVDAIGELTGGLPAVAACPAPESDALLAGLDALAAGLKRPRRLAQMIEGDAGVGLAAAVARLSGDVARVRGAVSGVAAREPARFAAVVSALDEKIARELADLRVFFRAATRTAPYTLATLPDEWRLRYLGAHGLIATYVMPAGDLSFEAQARSFHEDVTAAAPSVTGLPAIVWRGMTLVRTGWSTAAVWVALAVFAMVLADFQSVRGAVLALTPLAVGVAWMSGLMWAVGSPWNALSSLAVPILLGVGVDYGVHVLHRVEADGDLDRALAGGGRAIFYAAATTAVGFGSLALAEHRGLASFGLVSLFGVVFCMVAGLVVLPAIVRLSGTRRPVA